MARNKVKKEKPPVRLLGTMFLLVLGLVAVYVGMALGYTKLSTQEYPPPKQAGDILSSHLSHHVIIHSRVGHFQRIHQLVHYGPRLFRRAG